MDRRLDDFAEVKPSKCLSILPFYKRINPYYPIFLHTEVLKKLVRVSEKLPDGLNLQVDSGYRTLKTQKALWNNRGEKIPGLVYNPLDGLPPHLTGGAVDVSLVDGTGQELNLSAPHAKFYNEPQVYSKNITENAQNFRLLLRTLMLAEGFAPKDEEYWHFSYGDTAWAEHYKQEPLYGEFKAGKNIEYGIAKKLLYKVGRTIWKLYNHAFRPKKNY